MLQAFIITLREGVEASLIVGIVFAYLSKVGRTELKRTVFWALGSAIVASIGVAVVLARTAYNSDVLTTVNKMGDGNIQLGASILNGIITQQSYQIAFDELFYALGWIFLGLILFVWLTKPPFSAKSAASTGAH